MVVVIYCLSWTIMKLPEEIPSYMKYLLIIKILLILGGMTLLIVARYHTSA